MRSACSFIIFALVASAAGPATSPTDWSAVEAVDKLCSREITAVEYATALIEKANAWQCINAFAYFNETRVLAEAAAIDDKHRRGEDIRPLCGLAFVIKDILDVEGYPTVAGTPAFVDLLPPNTTPLVTRMLEANGVILGKTRPHELSWGGTSINPYFGAVLNAYANDRHVGGSSGGTGAAIAARISTGGFCSDTGGSCRIPASMNGVAGLRPSFGCYDAADGIVPMSTSRDTAGFMARTVKEIQLFNSILSSCPAEYTDVSLEGLRLGYPVERWDPEALDAEGESTLRKVITPLEKAGVTMVPLNFSSLEAMNDELNPTTLNIQYEIGREIARHLFVQRKNVSMTTLVDNIASPLVKAALIDATTTPINTKGRTTDDYNRMISHGRPTVFKAYADAFAEAGVDFLISPTTVTPPQPIDAAEPYQMVNGKLVRDAMLRFTWLDSSVQSPAVSMSAGLTQSGLPIGFQLNGLPGSDALMLSVAAALESVIPATPEPPAPACTGCTHTVGVINASYEGAGAPKDTDTWSVYTLNFTGTCSPSLTGRRPSDAVAAALPGFGQPHVKEEL